MTQLLFVAKCISGRKRKRWEKGKQKPVPGTVPRGRQLRSAPYTTLNSKNKRIKTRFYDVCLESMFGVKPSSPLVSMLFCSPNQITLILVWGGGYTSFSFKLRNMPRSTNFLVQNHLVNSYICIDDVLRPFLGHLDEIPRV